MKNCFGAVVCVLMMASTPVLATSDRDFKSLAGFIEKTKGETSLPSGTAVAIVKDGRVIYEGYFGFSDIEHKVPVTRDTVFYIASTTKPFMALNTLLMEEQGKINTATSLQQMFPEMHFSDIDAASVTLKDLLVHRSGIDNQALVWATAFSGIHDAASRQALVARSYPDADTPHGSFQYSNVGYNIVSVWLDKKLAQPWQRQLDERIFQPLRMTRTSAYISEAESRQWPLAKPYSFASKFPNEALYLRKSDDTMQAAGGLVSTASDLSKFLIAQLQDGKYRGKQMFPAALIAQSHQPQVTAEGSYLDFKRDGYAWGWYTGEYKGKTMLHHFGSFAGFHAHMSFIPEHNIGLVVLNNEDVLSARLTNLIADYAYGVMLDEPDIDAKTATRFDELLVQATKMQSAMTKQREVIERRDWKLSLAKQSYVGKYTNDLLGDMQVALNDDGSMLIRWGRLAAIASGYDELDHVRVEFSPNSGDIVSFEASDGRVDSITFANATFKKAKSGSE